MAEIGAAAIREIHHDEGDFAHHVDPAHRVVELDAVEDDELAVDTRNVAEVQVAVALAHEALLAAAQERVVARSVLALRPGTQRSRSRSRSAGVSTSGAIASKFRCARRRMRCGRAERRRRGRSGADRAMEAGDLRRERVDVGRPEQAARKQPAGQRVLRKFAHLHRVFQHGAGAAQLGRVDAAGDRHHIEIEVRGEPPVESELLVAEEPPRRKRREVEEAEIDRLLDLVGERAGQEHIRNVRLQHRGGRDRAAQGRGPRQRGD